LVEFKFSRYAKQQLSNRKNHSFGGCAFYPVLAIVVTLVNVVESVRPRPFSSERRNGPEMNNHESRYTSRENSFDQLAKGLASGTVSRRKALRLMGAALVGGALASIPAIAWTKPKPAGTCKKDKECPSPEDLCCNGVCTNVVFDRNNCGACGNRCEAGEGCCGQSCVPLNTPQNCGDCRNSCLETEQCVFDQQLQRYTCAAA